MRRDRTAHAAEGARGILRGCVDADVGLARNPAELGGRYGDERRERRAVVLAAHRAVAVHHELKRRIRLETERAAETTTFRHPRFLLRGRAHYASACGRPRTVRRSSLVLLAALPGALAQKCREPQRARTSELGIGDDQVEGGMPLRTFRERQAAETARRKRCTDSLFGKPCIARAHACCVDRRGLVGYGPAFLVEPADGTPALHALTAHNQVTMCPQ